MSGQPVWIELTTSIWTGGTMIAAIVGATVAWRVYLRDIRREMPIVEPDFDWKVDPVLGRFVEVGLKIVNRLDETLLIKSAKLDRPRSGDLSAGEVKTDPSGHPEMVPTASTERRMILNWIVQPSGSYTTWLSTGPTRTDLTRRSFYLLPPASWDGGFVRITLIASSKALTIRDRRIVIKRRLPAMTKSEAQDNASKIG